MITPKVASTHDVVIYDGAGNLGPVGLVARPFTYRVNHAPTMITRMSVGDPKGNDYEAWISWVQDDFRSGMSQVTAPTPSNARFFDSMWFLPDRDEGYLGVGTFPFCDYPTNINIFVNTVNFSTGASKKFARNQGKSFYMSQIAWGIPYAYDRIITPRGAFKVDGGTVSLVANWSTVGGAIDACRYSSCAIIAVQRSLGGYIAAMDILVHEHSWCRFLPHGSTSCNAVASYDSQLWRADVGYPRIAWYDIESINDSINPTWSDYNDVGNDGIILRMTPFIGRLFIAKTDGIWAYEAGRTYQVVDLSHMTTSDTWNSKNFMIFQEAHGALYWNLGNRLYRYTAGGLLEEMTAQLDSEPVSATTVRRGLCVVTKRYAYILDTNTGGLYRMTWSHKPTIAFAGMADGTLRIGPMSFTWSQYEYVSRFQASGNAEAGEPQFDKQALGFFKTCNQITLLSSWTDLGRPSLVKSWERALVRFDGVPTSSFPALNVYYRTEEERLEEGPYGGGLPGYTPLGALNFSLDATETGVATFDFPSNVHSRAMQVLLVLETNNTIFVTDERPRIYGFELEAAPVRSIGRALQRKQVSFSAVVTDNLELLSGEVENSAAWVTAAVYSLAGTGIVHTVAVPFPPPVGHTFRARVEFGPMGAVVPVLPSNYSAIPSGSPAAEISLVLTEV